MYIGLPLDCLASTIRSPYRLYAEDYGSGTELVGEYEGGACPGSHASWNVCSISVEAGKLTICVDKDFEAPHTDAFLIGEPEMSDFGASFVSKLFRKR